MQSLNSSKMEETKENNVVQVDESRKPYTEIVIGYERWTHNTYKVELVFKFYQQGGEPRVLIGEELFYKRTGEETFEEPILIDQYDFTESLHVTRIRQEEDYVEEKFSIDLSLTRAEFKEAALNDARKRMSEEDMSEYEEELEKLFGGLNLDSRMQFEMHGLYESTVWVRVPSFEERVARFYLARFHSIVNGESWSTREIEMERKGKEMEAKEQEELV